MAKGSLRAVDLALCALFAALLAVGAFLRIPLPGIAFSLQSLFVLLTVLLLGRRAVLAVGLYLVLGLAGLPIFTAGGGIGYVFYPSFGYLLGFLLGGFLGGPLAERGRDGPACLVTLAATYGLGLLYYYLLSRYYTGSPLGGGVLLAQGLIQTLPGDLALTALSLWLARRLRLLLRRGRGT